MTYGLVAVGFLAVAALVFLAAIIRAPDRRGVFARWSAPVAIAAGILIGLTIVFDNLMIAAGLMRYARPAVSGPTIGLMPALDLAYPLAAVILLPALWLLFRKSGRGMTATTTPRVARQLLLASRPLSWINTAFPFAAAYLLTTGRVDATFVVGTVYFLIPYNLALYGINDVFDFESDQRNPRKGGVEGAVLDRVMHRRVLLSAVVINVPFLGWLVAVGSPLSSVVLAFSLFALLAYSVPGLRFKEVPFLDSVTSSVHFVSPAVFGLALAGADFTSQLLALLVAFLLWGIGSHAFGAVQDVVPDREGGLASIATVLGARRAVRFAIAAWALAGLAMLATAWPGPLAALLVVPYILAAAPYWSVTDADSGSANGGWKRFLWINYACGLVATLLLIWFAALSTQLPLR